MRPVQGKKDGSLCSFVLLLNSMKAALQVESCS